MPPGAGRRDGAEGEATTDGDTPIVGQGDLADGRRVAQGDPAASGAEVFETDPVCGNRVDAAGGEPATFNGHAYYFDSPECRRLFDEAPDRFATLPDRKR